MYCHDCPRLDATNARFTCCQDETWDEKMQRRSLQFAAETQRRTKAAERRLAEHGNRHARRAAAAQARRR